MNARMFNGNNLSHKLLLRERQTTRLRNAFKNNMSTVLKLSKAQISKIIQSREFLGKLLGPLLKTGLPLLKSVIKPQQQTHQLMPVFKKRYMVLEQQISNDEINDIMKIVQALEDSGIILKGVTKTIKNETKEQKGRFLYMLLDTLLN